MRTWWDGRRMVMCIYTLREGGIEKIYIGDGKARVCSVDDIIYC